MAEQLPAGDVLPYDLNSPLFSDYTTKHRFIKLPPGTTMTYLANRTVAAAQQLYGNAAAATVTKAFADRGILPPS